MGDETADTVTPSRKCPATRTFASNVRRVLPTPAGPVSVSRRPCFRVSRSAIAVSSSSRPTRGVGCVCEEEKATTMALRFHD